MYLILEYARQTRRGIDLCLTDGLVLPALALLYSGIDVLGFLASTKSRATSQTFADWTSRYMTALLQKKGITGRDLFAARCGILHTGKAPSDLVDSGHARELWYEFRGESHINLIVNTPLPPVLLDVDEMVAAFASGLEQFATDLQTDPKMGQAAAQKAERFFRRGAFFDPAGRTFRWAGKPLIPDG